MVNQCQYTQRGGLCRRTRPRNKSPWGLNPAFTHANRRRNIQLAYSRPQAAHGLFAASVLKKSR